MARLVFPLRNFHTHFLSSGIRRSDVYLKANINTSQVQLGKTNTPIESLFISKKVQQILRNITTIDAEKVYGQEFTDKPMPPAYKLLSEDQLCQEEERTTKEIRRRLQIPPYLDFKPDPVEILARNPEIEGYLDYKHIFIDTTQGALPERRVMVVRERDGTLRTVTRKERDRMIQTFYPRKDSFMKTPRIFEDDTFEEMLNRGHHLNLLERATYQFEPDTEEFIMTTRKIYNHIERTGDYEKVESTRFFGHMVYYFTVSKKIDRLLMHLIKKQLVDNAADIVRLFCIVHPKDTISRGVQPNKKDSSLDILTKYAKKAEMGDAIRVALTFFDGSSQAAKEGDI